MHKSMGIVINPKASTGVGSIAMLLSNLKRADSKALAWPTPKLVKRPTYSGTRKEHRLPVIPLTDLTVIPKFRLTKESGISHKIEADKSKFYDILKHTKYNEIKDSLITKRYRGSVPSISGSFGRRGNRSSCSFRHRLIQERFRSTLTRNHYEVPQRPTAHKTTGPAKSLTDSIYNMLKGISIRKSPEPKSSKPESSTSAAILDIYDRTGEHRSKGAPRKRRVMGVTNSDLIPHEEEKNKISLIKKKKHKRKRHRRNTSQTIKKETDQEGLQEIYKITSGTPPSHDSVSIGSRRSKRRSSVQSIKKAKKSRLISDYDFVNREILNTLTDPDKIREFLRNIKELATKECSLFRQRFVEKTKPLDLKDPQAVEEYLDNLDVTVKLAARLPRKRPSKDVADSEADSISLDLQNMEKMRSQGDSNIKKIGKKKSVIQFENVSQNSLDASFATKVERPINTPRKLKISNRRDTPNVKLSEMDLSKSKDRRNVKPQQAESSKSLREMPAIRKRNKYAEPIIVKSRVKIDLSAFEPKVDVNLPFVSPISYDEMTKLSPEEFNKIFTTVDRVNKSRSFLKSKKSQESHLPLSYQYRMNQVRNFLYGSNVSLADLENISIDDIDFNKFLNYAYPDKYMEQSSPSRTSIRGSHKKSKSDKRSHKSVQKFPDLGKTEGRGSKVESVTPPAKPKCCICHSIQRTKPKRDDPLIVKMKNEMKRQALKAYIKEKRLYPGFDQIFNNDHFTFDNRPVLVPCEKPRRDCNVFYKNA